MHSMRYSTATWATRQRTFAS